MKIYLVFTQEGLSDSVDTLIANQAALWINPDILTPEQRSHLHAHHIDIHEFDSHIDVGHERAVIEALEKVERRHPDADIFVEYL